MNHPSIPKNPLQKSYERRIRAQRKADEIPYVRMRMSDRDPPAWMDWVDEEEG